MTNSPPLSLAGVAQALAALGYPRTFVKKVLPAWWDGAAATNSAGALEFALMLRDRFGLRCVFNNEGRLHIEVATPGVRYKKRASTELPSLATSTRLGAALGRLAIRTAVVTDPLPASAPELHRQLVALSGGKPITLEVLVRRAWQAGVPVLMLRLLPAKATKMAGMVIRHRGRFAIVLAHAYAENARQGFVLAHELGHIVLGHLMDDGLLVDETIESVEETLRRTNQDDEEVQADSFALEILRGDFQPRPFQGLGRSPAMIAAAALQATKGTTVDPAHLILTHAHDTHDWRNATQAMRYLQGAREAHSVIREVFDAEANVDELSLDEITYLYDMQGFARSLR